MNRELITKAFALADGLDAVTAPGPVSACLRELARSCELLQKDTSPPPQRKPLTDEQREHLRDAFAQSLTSVYVCGRVWGAWRYGTMSEGDFQPAGECEEVLDALIEATHGITAPPDTARLDWLARNALAALDIFGRVKAERDKQDVRKDIDNAIHQQGTDHDPTHPPHS